MKTFYLRVLAASRVFYEGECESLVVPTIDGLYGFMANHEDMVIAIVPGMLTLRAPGGDEQIAAVSEGMLRMEHNEALLLVDTAERPEEIDLRLAEEAAARAKEKLHEKLSAQEEAVAMARMARALSRAKVKRRGK